MKILAIRGENLASLAGAFAVDLRQPPLSGAGLFAITGQTGSGKSTLLDAMCLALFDQTPRLSERSRGVIGRDEDDKKRQVGSSDSRSVLRRGTTEGYAEVEFLGVDDRVYRSRWSVRRARRKVTGRLQSAKMEVWDVATDRRLDSDKKTRTLRIIEKQLGLGFDQFRRSVLLPQGEFAAFLKASEEERSALLERMTGTQVYREISIRAFRRARDEKRSFEQLQEKLSVLELLDDEALDALNRAQSSGRAEERVLKESVERAERAVSWHQRLDALHAVERDAEGALARAQASVSDLADLETELSAIASVEALRPLVEGRNRVASAHAEAQATQERLLAQLAEAKASAEQASAASAAADAALSRERARQESLAAVLSKATALDGEIASLGRELVKAERASREAATSLEGASRAVAASAQAITQLQQSVERETGWLEERSALRPLASRWDRWEVELRRGASALSTLQTSQAREGERVAAAAATQHARDEAAAALDVAQAAVAPLRAAVDAARTALDAHPGADALNAQQRALYARQKTTDRLMGLRLQLIDVEKRRGQRAAAGELARDQERTASMTADAADEQFKQVGWMLSEAERFLEQVRADEVLTERRELLQSGQPCPLCGSTTHPWAGAPRPLAQIFQSQIDRVQQLRDQKNDIALRSQQARTDAERLKREASQADQDATGLAARGAELRMEWASASEGLSLPSPEGSHDALVGLHEEIASSLASVEASLTERSRLQDAMDVAERSRSTATEARDEAARRLQLATEEQAAAQRSLRQLTEVIERARARWAESEAALQVPMAALSPSWASSLRAEPAAFVEQCAARVVGVQQAEERLLAAEKQLSALRPEFEAARSRLEERSATARRLKSTFLERKEQLDARQEARSRLLGGQDTEAVRASLRGALSQAEHRRDASATLREETRRRVAELTARQESAVSELQRRGEELGAAKTALSDALASRGLSEDDVATRLQRPASWVVEQRARLQAAKSAVSQAAAVLEERRRQRRRDRKSHV